MERGEFEEDSGHEKKPGEASSKVRRATEAYRIPAVFSRSEAKQIREYYKFLKRQKEAEDDGDYFQVDDVVQVPELSLNPFIARIAEIVHDSFPDKDGLRKDEITGEMFFEVLSVFHKKTPRETKQRCKLKEETTREPCNLSDVSFKTDAFEIFDNNCDGEVTRADFIYGLGTILQGLPLNELEVHSDLVFESIGKEKFNSDDFGKVFDYAGFERYFTIHF